MRVFAAGVCNLYGLAFSPGGQLFATYSAPDDPDNTLLYVSSDELNLIVERGDIDVILGVKGGLSSQTYWATWPIERNMLARKRVPRRHGDGQHNLLT